MKDSKTSPSILTFVGYYLPGYKSGGPVRTIANLVEHFGDEFNFYIVSSDRDATDTIPYKEINVDDWNSVGKAKVFYASPSMQSIRRISNLINKTPHDILYLNSFFDPLFTVRVLLARKLGFFHGKPLVIAPRGEFSQGALQLKRFKKWLYLQVTGWVGLYKNLIWQASSEYEAADIRMALGDIAKRIVIAPNLPALFDEKEILSKQNDDQQGRPLRIIFLSRIAPMKNLYFVLQVLSKVKVPIEFNIYGSIDDEAYWRRCQKKIIELPTHITATYHGVIPHNEVNRALAGNDLFFLPTLGENYGHAIFESLAAGIPVLISNKTPWKDLESANVGWIVQLEKADIYVDVIESYADLSPPERRTIRNAARRYANCVANSSAVRQANRTLFDGLSDSDFN
jgi:glycosyltransferase involved in cell wall biosynthesis